MKLFKNVDIADLNSILAKGILSLDESENNNWEDGNRANNPTDCVYMFNPLGEENSFPNYGAALLEIEINNARKVEMQKNDAYNGKYEEWVAPFVPAENIKAIYVPAIFRERLESYIGTLRDIKRATFDKITFVEIECMTYKIGEGFVKANEEDINLLGSTAAFFNSSFEDCFLRATMPNRNVQDFYEFKYNF